MQKLEDSLEALGMAEHEDTRIMPIYIEYWVANELVKFGHNVQIVNRRSFDILLPEKGVRIEVKSGKYNGVVAGASFGKGDQIKNAAFDYCVFATYDIDLRVEESMVFRLQELEEIAKKPRTKKVAMYPKTNPCILLRYDSFDQYLRYIEKGDRLEIELNLHKFPEKYVNRWEKIK
ncbi:MAG: hypothetical protein OEY22_10770 [Candidatus Bathyarchaeota archaeon]|nr:hypothetical protein [Candidatus Bathyarchaeota archaeon]